MSEPRLEITDSLGTRILVVDKDRLTIGRRTSNDICLADGDVSREHAEIVQTGPREFAVCDRASRYGTFVNGEQIERRVLRHADVIRFGRTATTQIVYLDDVSTNTVDGTTIAAVGGLRQVAMLLEALRALGTGKVLDEVLALVIDSAIELSGADRGFIMLADDAGALQFMLARGRGHVTLPGRTFSTSRKVPEEVFASGEAKMLHDLLDGDLGQAHTGTIALGIRSVLCVPLASAEYNRQEHATRAKRVGVLYLDGWERGTPLSSDAQAAVEVLAAEAAVAIEHARLYREAVEKSRLEDELKVAAGIQQALIPQTRRSGPFFDVMGLSVACRSIGGDFFDCIDLPSGTLGIALGDVAGKGAPAALLAALLEGQFSANAAFGVGTAEMMARLNQALVHRSLESRFATMFYSTLAPDGRFTYCNAGHNPPFLIRTNGEVNRLSTGGLILGLFPAATYEEELLQLAPGETLLIYSDGVSEAVDGDGNEFGDERILACLTANVALDTPQLLGTLLDTVRVFCNGVPPRDDVTALVVRYTGEGRR